MRLSRSSNNLFFVALSLLAGVLVCTISSHAQAVAQSLDWLSTESLSDLGVHLPSYINTVQAQMAYQAKVPLHQEITVAWSENTGGQKPSGPGFLLVKRMQHMQQVADVSALKAQDQPILVIAVTPDGEVRAFALYADTRFTTGQLVIQLPQDGQISRLLFMSVDAGQHLDRIGQVDVGLPDGTPQSAQKSKTTPGTSK
jgi:hypothetical protein